MVPNTLQGTREYPGLETDLVKSQLTVSYSCLHLAVDHSFPNHRKLVSELHWLDYLWMLYPGSFTSQLPLKCVSEGETSIFQPTFNSWKKHIGYILTWLTSVSIRKCVPLILVLRLEIWSICFQFIVVPLCILFRYQRKRPCNFCSLFLISPHTYTHYGWTLREPFLPPYLDYFSTS